MSTSTKPRDVTPSHHVTKLHNYTRPAKLFRSLTQLRSQNRPKTTPGVTAAERQPGQFASALAHEVRNPLSTINLAVEMLKSTIRDDDQKMYLDVIQRGSTRINDLVTDLLVSCQDDEKQSEKYPIHQLLEEVMAMNEDRIRLKQVSVRKDYSTLDCKVLVDKEKIKIALTNIVINAIDAMPPGKGRLKLVTRSMNDQCIMEIQDNGTGISQENLKNIFKPYFTNKPNGLGLGLSTTLDILEANHAGVNVQSEEGVGTNFILSFDRCQPPEDRAHTIGQPEKTLYGKPVSITA